MRVKIKGIILYYFSLPFKRVFPIFPSPLPPPLKLPVLLSHKGDLQKALLEDLRAELNS
jgi:hypothetical protein